MKVHFIAALILAASACLFTTYAEAKSCDGYHGCRCGVTAANYNGISINYNGFNLKRAVEWIRAFPRTSFQAGAVGYVPHGGPSGHVFTVVGGSDCSTATVHDDRGTYRRNVCHATFVAAHGGGEVHHTRVAVHHEKHRTRHVQTAAYAPPDRHAIY